jgi:hypothetical protein
MFTLHGSFKSRIILLVYDLLIEKKIDGCNLFFENVLKKDTFDPESILTDFETGTNKYVESLFLNVLQKGNSTIG